MNNKDNIEKIVNCIICAIVSVLVFAFCISIAILCACIIQEGGARIGAIIAWSLISGLAATVTFTSLWCARSFVKDIHSNEE